jgi:hypothetical protein
MPEEFLARRNAVLDQLRALARAYPDDAAVREILARWLARTRSYDELRPRPHLS